MKLYKTTYIDDALEESGRSGRVTWDATQADAVKSRKQLKADGMREIQTQETNVPTDKKGLLGFLNQWCGIT